MPSNDNDSPVPGAMTRAADPHGHAALLLVESLIHGLCENSTLSTNEAIEIAERAVHVQSEQAEAADGAGEPLWQSHALLAAIAASLKIDGRGDPTPPRLVT
jgi:hypothetical protein